MWSSRNGKKVVRTESMLDENKIYFSHMLSPVPWKQQQQQQQKQNNYNYVDNYNHSYNYNYDYNMQQQHQAYYGGGKQGSGKEHEDVNAKAEQFIQKKHQKFGLSK